MKILVTATSKHGATAEIANAIGEALRRRGREVTVAPAEKVDSVDCYDAYVLGGAVYAGHWLQPAIEIRATTIARDRAPFARKLDESELGFAKRANMVAFRAPVEDFRNWEEIAHWATSIAGALAETGGEAPWLAPYAIHASGEEILAGRN